MPRYDLFRLDKGSHTWVGTAETMDEANAHANRLLVNCPECVVLDQTTGEKIVIKAGLAGEKTKSPSYYRHS
jgi:hypothetical protein